MNYDYIEIFKELDRGTSLSKELLDILNQKQ